MGKLTAMALSWNWFKLGVYGNKWLWFHILGGGVLARVFTLWMTDKQTLLSVALVAVLWELIELVFETHLDPASVYGSEDKWFWDSMGDIFGTILCALLVVSMNWG